MKNNDLFEKKWFLVSYDSLRTSLVGGNRLHRLNQFLQKEGIDSTLISRQIRRKEGIPVSEYRFIRAVRNRLRGAFITDPSLWWAWRVYRLLSQFEKDSVWLTSAPPFGVSMTGLIGRFLKKEFYWIADFRDSWTLNPLYRPFPFGKLFSRPYEKAVFKKSDLVIFNTDTDRDNYCLKYAFLEEKSIVIRNGFSEFISNNASEKIDETVKIIYSGGAYPAASAAKNVVRFVEMINRSGLALICDYFGEYHPVLSESDYLEYKGKVRQEDVPKVLSNYRFGLIYLQEECLGGGRVTQKFYDYLGSGVLPIVINPSQEMTNMMSELQTGVALFSKTDLRSVMPILASKIGSEQQELNPEMIREYSTVFQFEKLLEHFS